MVKVENAGAEKWEGGRWGVFRKSVGDYLVSTLMKEGDVVYLVEPSNIVVLDEYMA